MKTRPFLIIFVVLSICKTSFADEPDSAYIFSYATGKNNDKNGMHYAWSVDNKNWHAIGPEFRFLFCDFGRWGSQKRLISPFIIKDQDGLFHCIWSLNEQVGAFAHTASKDFYTWGRQSYPTVMNKGNCKLLEASFDAANNQYKITWLSQIEGEVKIFKNYTSDFKTYTPTTEANQADRLGIGCQEVLIEGEKQSGTVQKISWSMVDGILKRHQWLLFHEQQRAENMGGDSARFALLKPVDAAITLNPTDNKKISELLIGIFFEDISYAADGGLYAELVQNRGFEYALSDKEGRDTTWNSFKAWSLKGDGAGFKIDTVSPLHPNTKHYVVLDIKEIGAGLVNEGFDRISLKAGEKYNFSVFARILNGTNGNILVRLIGDSSEVFGEVKTKNISSEWQKYEAVLSSDKTINNARIELIPQIKGSVALDMISLFPQKTFKGHKNGLREDLAQTIADIKPAFIRFPGGCVAHGDGIDNIYKWKNTVGPLEARKAQRNIWGYHQSMGLGYYEYFQFCEDIGSEPLPVLAAGVPCQNSGTGGHGQQGGIPMCEMDDYVQDVLDLVEWANGDKTTKWGKMRAEAGHPEPFNLKYIGIGNEDLITDIFEERFTMIFNALKEKHPEITVIGTVGPFYMGTDYDEGWELATKLKIPIVDEHYYQSPGWFLNNQDFYDKYDRSKSKVYLGEYAAHAYRRRTNIETALSEALYLTCIERNADIVEMTSYAPLLAKEGHTNWNPDLIYFNNSEVKPTVDYYVQQLFGHNAGDLYVPGMIKLSNSQEDVKKRVAMSVVLDSKSGHLILKLVNMLPVEVNSVIDLSGFEIVDTTAVLQVLKGKPDDREAKPETSSIKVSKMFNYQLQAYSFSVIRTKIKD